MFYLLLAISSNIMTIFVMRRSEKSAGNRYATTVFNYVAGVLVSLFLMKEKVFFYNTPEGWFALGLAFINAICMTSGMILNQLNVGKNGAPMTATFSKLGILIPTALSMVLFSEIPTPVQMGGLALAVVAIVYLNGGKGEHSGVQSFSLLVILFVVCGCIDLCSKLYGVYGDAAIRDYYVFYSFVFNTLLSLILLAKHDTTIRKQDVVNGILLGIPNQLITYSMVRVVLFMPAYLAFPLSSAGVILAVNVINFLVFREKLSRREIQATGLIGLALILLNI